MRLLKEAPAAPRTSNQVRRIRRSDEERLGGENKVVVLSHGLWQRDFGGNAKLVGKSILLNGESRIVAGHIVAAIPEARTTRLRQALSPGAASG